MAWPKFTAHATVRRIRKPRNSERGPPAVRAEPIPRKTAVPMTVESYQSRESQKGIHNLHNLNIIVHRSFHDGVGVRNVEVSGMAH